MQSVIFSFFNSMFAHIFLRTHTELCGSALSFKATGLSLHYHLLVASDNTSVTTAQTKT